MAQFTVVLETELDADLPALDALAEMVMDALEDVAATDPFVYVDGERRMLRLEVVVDAADRAHALPAGMSVIGKALDTVVIEGVGDVSAHAEELVPA